MKTFTQLGLASTALAAALTLASTLSHAAPEVASVKESGLHGQQDKKKPSVTAKTKIDCGANTQAVLYTRTETTVLGRVTPSDTTPQWHGGDIPSESPHAYRVLQGNGDTTFDGFNDRCALADSDGEKDSRINDGVDVSQLFDNINELLEFNKKPTEDDEHKLLNMEKDQVRFDISDDDHTLHAFTGAGRSINDFGRVGDKAKYQWNNIDGRERVVVEYSEKDRRYHATLELNTGKRLDIRPQEAVPAVPEPETYMMLLAGLGLLTLVKRYKRTT